MVSVMKQEVAEMKTQTVKRGATMIGGKAFEEEQLKNAIRVKNTRNFSSCVIFAEVLIYSFFRIRMRKLTSISPKSRP